ncbi:nucleoside phosphorylase domain-containing protein [Phaeosphaeriaceae sp. PMI808]|nr:nucleoside phosphorylase domain-containing protein [Phaeosphaeriaceae sp. PMI808]
MSKKHSETVDSQEALSSSKKRMVDYEKIRTLTVEKPKRKLTTDDYTVGWICPLEVEHTAAMVMLDEEHERLPQQSTDHNAYNLGSIQGHNVVITGLPQTGNNSAAAVVTQLRMTFRNLRFGLLVGIGGGVPVKTDNGMIRLGDVIVSKPVGEHPGAVQYDHGKAKVGKFERTGVLAPPPAVLLNAAQDLATKRARSRKDPVQENIKRIDTSIRGLRKYKHPGMASDHLYEANYIHRNPELSCNECGCDSSKRIPREADDDDNDEKPYIVVHRGTIASGEALIKDAMLRDRLAKEYSLLCFEMEAAGALADFPCIIIRGISHYCDSHKNNQWHGYAAAVATAYGRQLFFHMPVNDVTRLWTSDKKIKTIEKSLSGFSPTNFRAQQQDIISQRQKGTSQWFLDSVEFQEWLQGPNKTLFCPGIPGAGKTMMVAVAIDFLYREKKKRDSIGIACLFCNYKAQADQSAVNLLASILKQLIQTRQSIPEPV